ncbi:MAG: FHA domain-containing protein [Planctomycetes bacterium]|nr:FHA domain-containing protein [Planctomycetota bacterium]
MPFLRIREPGGPRATVPLESDSALIGRSPSAAIRLKDKTVSKQHALLLTEGGGVKIVDAGSRNGILVNGARVKIATLRDGDRIRIGRAVIVFRTAMAAARPHRSRARMWARDAPYWTISAALHMILLLLMGAYVVYAPRPPEKEHKLLVRRGQTPPKFDPTLKRAMFKRPEILDREEDVRPVIQLKPDEIQMAIPRGTDLDNFANKNLEGRFYVDGIGVGGGASGAFGNRMGKGSLIREGGGPGTEKAVLAALYWLSRHQHPDGRWSSHDFTDRCGSTPGARDRICKNKNPRLGDGRGTEGHDVAVTALAILAFTGAGHTHLFGEYPEFVETVRKGAMWLKSVQVTSADDPQRGRFGARCDSHWIYDQALAAMAVGEILVLSGDTIGFSKCVELAAEFVLNAQNPGLGWRYGFRTGDNDTSVTGWMVLALKSCAAAGLSRPEPARYRQAFRGALAWLDRATNAETGLTGYQAPERRAQGRVLTMTSVGILCRIFSGERRASPIIRGGVDAVVANLPAWQEGSRGGSRIINLYHWYYATYALFQVGGEPWKTWNVAMRRALVDSQRVGGCEDGSWDPIGQWCPQGGRVYATALGAMTLEVYYRFTRAGG